MNSTIHTLLPKKLLSKVMYKISRIEQPYISQAAIRLFMKATGACLDEAKYSDIKHYKTLLDFFTRELKEGVRPITSDENSIACPVDGRVAHVGNILEEQIFQIKGYTYSLNQLVGNDYAENYYNGQATTIYLAPFDYHRIHSPLSATLKKARYIPGELNSVSITLLDKIAGLFAKNERVVLEFETDSGLPFLMVLVGAVNVGSIETVFHSEICPNNYTDTVELPTNNETINKGDEIGRFNLGSTIVFITPPNSLSWNITDNVKTQMGEKIGELL